MAAATVMPAMPADSDKVHPFFSRQQGFGQTGHDEPSENNPDEQLDKPRRTSSKRKKPKDGQKPKTQKTLGEIINPKASAPPTSAVVDLCSSEPDVHQGRRKRRRTNDSDAIDAGSEDIPASSGAEERPRNAIDEGRRSPIVLISNSSPLRQRIAATINAAPDDAAVIQTPPKKLLRLNAQGRFSSPPSKKSKDEDEAEQEPPRRGTRQRKSTQATPEKKKLVVVLEFGGDDHEKRQCLGDRIDRILNGQETVSLMQKPASKKGPSQKPQPSKPTHPFFAKGGNDVEQQQPPSKRESPHKSSAITPGKLKMQSAERAHDSEEPTHIFTSALLKDRHMIKHPGATDAPFPAKEQVHVRSLEATFVDPSGAPSDLNKSTRQRKRKQAQLPFPRKESLLSRFESQLKAEDERKLRADGYYEPDASLRVPRRLLISGSEIAERIAEEVSVPLTESDIDELSSMDHKYIHPALQRLYTKIPTTLTAFDHSRGETQAWSEKYAPSSSAEVLQSGKMTTVLRDWMRSLAVQSVIGAAAPPSISTSSKTAEKPKKKRKKKSAEMDDFLVSSDEEVHDMTEMIDDDDGTTNTRKTAHSVVQAVQDGTKLSNAVLLSGPHGCGKTAAAYAVAKELGFKVFEISSSERRSGRDVLDRVGDMTANHLVKHHGVVEDRSERSSSEEPSRIEEAFQKDLQSGRQGKMSSFFKPKAAKKQDAPKKIIKEKVVKAIQESLKKPAKDQQQSIILLEEVDILFRDDKEFWTTVLKLITTSKRPFILTCNDEDLVPCNAMTFHAMLRFVQPPPDLATDYLLLLAAAEGHLLKRQAVLSLYEQHGHDLRASITELDYWCQMGVGDPREGLGWIYQRWPPGSDLDQKGRQLRVVSDGTYQQGMGLPSKSESTEDALLWMWAEYGIEPSTAFGWQSDLLEHHPTAGASGKERRQELVQFANLAEALSATDAFSSNGLPGTASLDTTQKPVSKEARGNYIEGLEFLQTDERIDWTNLSKEILTAMTISAHRTFSPDSIDEDNIIQGMLSRKAPTTNDNALSRRSFACFDAISFPSELSLGMQQSAFDSNFETIVLDLAPYVRSIVQYDQALEEQRDRLDLLTSDGRRPKRARTTRAARSAQEGGQRATVRRERWFSKSLNMDAVLATGGQDWPRLSGQLGTASVGSRDGTETGTATASRGDSEEIQYEDSWE